MPITLTNLPAVDIANNLENVNQAYDKSLERLSTGKRFNSPGDDPSGAARATGLQVQVSALGQARQNGANAKSIVEMAEGGLNEVNNLLLRMRELSLAAANQDVSPDEQDAIASEITSTASEIDRLAQSTKFAGKNLLNGQGKPLVFQIGPNNTENDRITFDANINATASGLGVSNLNVYSPDDALDAMGTIDKAIGKVQSYRGQTGAFAERLDSIDQIARFKRGNAYEGAIEIDGYRLRFRVDRCGHFGYPTENAYFVAHAR